MESRGMEGGGGHSPCFQNAQPLAGDKLGAETEMGAGMGGIRGSCSRYPRGAERVRQALPHLRGPRHTPPSLLLDHRPPTLPSQPLFNTSGLTSDQQFSRGAFQSSHTQVTTPPGDS